MPISEILRQTIAQLLDMQVDMQDRSELPDGHVISSFIGVSNDLYAIMSDGSIFLVDLKKVA